MRFSVFVTVAALLRSGVNAFTPTPHPTFTSSVVQSNVVQKPISALWAEKGNDVVETSEKAKDMIDQFRNKMGTRGKDGEKKVC